VPPEFRTEEQRWPSSMADDASHPIPDHLVRRAIELIDTSGILRVVDGWRAQDRRGPGGRPETFGVRALLVAMLLCAVTDTPMLARRFTGALFIRISPEMRRALGVVSPPDPGDDQGWEAVYRNIRTRLHGLLRLMDPSPRPKNRRLSHEQFEAICELRRAGLSEAAWEERYERLTWFVNALLEMSVRTLPRETRRRWRGNIAVDATVVPSFARHDRRVARRRRNEMPAVITHSADSDADWYTRDKSDPDAESGPSQTSVWGYEASLAVTGAESDDEGEAFPGLAIGMAPLHKPSHAPGANAIRALASIRARGYPARYLAADRAYTEAKAENFQLPAKALGYRVVLDYKRTQLGIQDSYGGMLLIEGGWYCPCIPDVLINASIDFDAGTIDEPTYRARLAERWRYRIITKSGADEGGHIRVRCPASNPQPVARCDLKPTSVHSGTQGRLRIPVKRDIATHRPKICTQQSITLPPENGAKYAQELPYRSDSWKAKYSVLRNGIEGFNGFVKDGNHHVLDDPERRRIHGVAAQSVFVALLLVAANMRKIRTFLGELAAQKTGKLRRLAPRRRTRDLGAWLPATGAIDPQVEPEPPPRSA